MISQPNSDEMSCQNAFTFPPNQTDQLSIPNTLSDLSMNGSYPNESLSKDDSEIVSHKKATQKRVVFWLASMIIVCMVSVLLTYIYRS